MSPIEIFSVVILATGVAILALATLYIIIMLISIAFGLIYTPIDEHFHHNHREY